MPMDVTQRSGALIVDDSALLLLVVGEMFEDAGYRVLTASSGDAALEILESKASSITVMFSDINMPGKVDGVMLAQVAASRWPHIRTILSSGLSRSDVHDFPSSCSYIGKPFTHASLTSLLQSPGAIGASAATSFAPGAFKGNSDVHAQA
jgi:CheY-like chemotaxis protein